MQNLEASPEKIAAAIKESLRKAVEHYSQRENQQATDAMRECRRHYEEAITQGHMVVFVIEADAFYKQTAGDAHAQDCIKLLSDEDDNPLVHCTANQEFMSGGISGTAIPDTFIGQIAPSQGLIRVRPVPSETFPETTFHSFGPIEVLDVECYPLNR